MLDKRTSFLLQKTDELCRDGKYQIVDAADLLACFPSDYHVTEEGLKEMISYLCRNEYVNVKYAENGMYCICPLPAGRIYLEKNKEKRRETSKKLLFPALAAFAGAVIGAFSALLLCLLWMRLF